VSGGSGRTRARITDHDAVNDSDDVRIVLWLDVARRMSLPFDLVNRAALWIGFRDPSVSQVRRNAVVSALPAATTFRPMSIERAQEKDGLRHS